MMEACFSSQLPSWSPAIWVRRKMRSSARWAMPSFSNRACNSAEISPVFFWHPVAHNARARQAANPAFKSLFFIGLKDQQKQCYCNQCDDGGQAGVNDPV